MPHTIEVAEPLLRTRVRSMLHSGPGTTVLRSVLMKEETSRDSYK